MNCDGSAHGTGGRVAAALGPPLPAERDPAERDPAERDPAVCDAGGDPATVVRAWREAASLLEAAVEAVAAFECPETVAIQDAANIRAGEAFAALAAVEALDPEVLRGHADALEWLIRTFGALSDNPSDATPCRSIAAELRAAADRLPGLPPARESAEPLS